MEDARKKDGRGGAREGAGRPRTNHGRYFGFNSTKEVERILDSLGRSRTAFINEAVADYARRKGIVCL